ncbi:MAG: hypothetical protein AAF747_02565 [Planctomycetota bacterium]
MPTPDAGSVVYQERGMPLKERTIYVYGVGIAVVPFAAILILGLLLGMDLVPAMMSNWHVMTPVLLLSASGISMIVSNRVFLARYRRELVLRRGGAILRVSKDFTTWGDRNWSVGPDALRLMRVLGQERHTFVKVTLHCCIGEVSGKFMVLAALRDEDAVRRFEQDLLMHCKRVGVHVDSESLVVDASASA